MNKEIKTVDDYISNFPSEIKTVYKQGKGSVQFPLDQQLPVALIKDIIKFRLKINNKI